MEEVFLKIVEAAPVPNRAWVAELWSGAPSDPNAKLLAGGSSANPPARFTQTDLEAGMVFKGHLIGLSREDVEKMINDDALPPPDMAEAIGRRLYELLDKAGVAGKWSELRQQARGVRTYLSVPEGLASWPWEFLARPASARLSDHLFLEARNPIVRIGPSFADSKRQDDGVVRVLLVSGQEKLDATSNASAELRKIRSAFHEAGVAALVCMCEAPDETQLKKCLEEFQPHILHFIGHGSAPAQGSDFELQFQNREPWPASEIYNYFRQATWKPQLVVLNACHSATVAAEAASIAEVLLTAGIQAVVGAQAELGIDNAKQFATNFYEKLVAIPPAEMVGMTIDKAFVEARRAIQSQTGVNSRHWALPVLTVGTPIDRIPRFKRAHAEILSCPEVKDIFVRPGRFVNRTTDRWKLLSSFRPAVKDAPAARCLILLGEGRLGKSWLIKRAVRDFLDAGFMVTHANMSGRTERSSLHVLEDWHGDPNPEPPSFLRSDVAGDHFADFERELARARRANPGDNQAGVFTAFKKGLAGLRAKRNGRPLLLVLDQLSSDSSSVTVTPQDFRQGLLNQLLIPLDKGDSDVDGIYALLIVGVKAAQFGVQVLPFDTNTIATDIDSQTVQRLIGANRIPEFADYGLADLFRGRVLQVPRLAPVDADNLFDEFADFQTNDAIQALRQVFVLMRNSWYDQDDKHDQQDFFAKIDSLFPNARLKGVTPL